MAGLNEIDELEDLGGQDEWNVDLKDGSRQQSANSWNVPDKSNGVDQPLDDPAPQKESWDVPVEDISTRKEEDANGSVPVTGLEVKASLEDADTAVKPASETKTVVKKKKKKKKKKKINRFGKEL